jgi:hypothetical protein
MSFSQVLKTILNLRLPARDFGNSLDRFSDHDDHPITAINGDLPISIYND